MTNDEKFSAIIERTKIDGLVIQPEYISMMMIISYLDKLAKMKVVECAFNISPLGESVVAICEEFDWKPSDIDIKNFIMEMVEDNDKPGFTYMIMMYRDDLEGLKKSIEENRPKSI